LIFLFDLFLNGVLSKALLPQAVVDDRVNLGLLDIVSREIQVFRAGIVPSIVRSRLCLFDTTLREIFAFAVDLSLLIGELLFFILHSITH